MKVNAGRDETQIKDKHGHRKRKKMRNSKVRRKKGRDRRAEKDKEVIAKDREVEKVNVFFCNFFHLKSFKIGKGTEKLDLLKLSVS